MAWHIFRKDWRLMWPLAVGTAVLQAWILILTTHSTPLPLSEATSMFASIVTLVLAIAMTLLIVLSIQQESIPSISQDWLTRPVERGDLLLGKLLTIALLIHGPIFAVNILQGLMEGFSLGPVLLAALHSNFEIALCYSLPVMVIAATTRGVVEAIVFGLIVLVIYKSTLTMHKDEQLFLNDASSLMQAEQTELSTKVNRLTLPVRVFGMGLGYFSSYSWRCGFTKS